MSTHFKEIMEDGETFGWPTVGAYHMVWLQHLEQGRATWGDETTRLKLCRALIWHRTAPSSQHSQPYLSYHTPGSHLSPQVSSPRRGRGMHHLQPGAVHH